jgi:hypothetical protein
VPVRNTSVRDTRSYVEHDDCALALNAVEMKYIRKNVISFEILNEIFIACSVSTWTY